MFELTLTAAAPHEEPFAAAMLAELYGYSLTPYIARIANATVGAVAIDWVNRDAAARFRTHVHVMPAFRRQGIGRRIVDRVAAMVSGETDALAGFTPFQEGDVADNFARRCGFDVSRRLCHFRIDDPAIVDELDMLQSRLGERGRIPANLRVVSASQAPQDDLAMLLAQSLGTHQPRLADLLAMSGRAADGIDLDRSVTVLNGNAIVGALILRWRGSEALIEGNVVAPGYRRSPVNLMQLAATARHALAAGATACTYICDETVVDSVKFARRAGGVLTRSNVDLVRPIRP